MAVVMHCPLTLLVAAIPATERNFKMVVRLTPLASLPYVADGQAPVLNSRAALLLDLVSCLMRSTLALMDLIRLSRTAVVRRLPPTVPTPRSLPPGADVTSTPLRFNNLTTSCLLFRCLAITVVLMETFKQFPLTQLANRSAACRSGYGTSSSPRPRDV